MLLLPTLRQARLLLRTLKHPAVAQLVLTKWTTYVAFSSLWLSCMCHAPSCESAAVVTVSCLCKWIESCAWLQDKPVHLAHTPDDMPSDAADTYVTNGHHRFGLQKMGLMTALANRNAPA